jgi:hypothetical protein
LRYIALMLHSSAGWVALFPDFPEIAVQSFGLQDAFRRARQELIDWVNTRRLVGSPAPTPMSAATLVRDPFYREAMVAIVTLPEPAGPEDSTVVHFGRS